MTEHNENRYRFYLVHGFIFPSDITPVHILPIAPKARLRDVICVGDLILHAGVKEIITKHKARVTMWYYLFGKEYEHIFTNAVDRAIIYSDEYKEIKIPVTDISQITDISQLPIPYYSAHIVPVDAKLVSQYTGFYWWMHQGFVSEMIRLKDYADTPKEIPEESKTERVMTEEERERELLKHTLQEHN